MATQKLQTQGLPRVVFASSVGTLIEWYDFYLFGSLASIISLQFFPKGNPTAALLSTLAAFAAGFVVRPFGAVFFGRLGDLVGRKYTFLVTLSLMGGATFLIGLVPSYETIGFLAPAIVVSLRLLQGLALGGEYGGATTYVGEHSPVGKRGFYTSWIQTTATVGLLVSLLVIQGVKGSMSEQDFADWGWRIPFLLSIFLLMISIYIRVRMEESPLFKKLKDEGKISTNPLKESFGNKKNLKYVLLALLGATMGQGVIWYTGQFYALRFIRSQGMEFTQTNNVVLIALVFATPFFIVFGALSDKIGRKWIMALGMFLGIMTYFPIYKKMHGVIDTSNKVKIEASSSESTGSMVEDNTRYDVTTANNQYTDGTKAKIVTKINLETGEETVKRTINLGDNAFWWLVVLIFIQVIYVTMVYGPIAAFLIELFPTKIRYTSMSLPYHIGNGVFGGLVPLISTALVVFATQRGDDDAYLAGLWYPIGVAAVCLVISVFYINHRSYQMAED
ncbi:MAG: MHS family MFS transporter [SAR324 cluster bacterium]|nr:MHS family MFS transporter [SAR324 cluster bacterium]